MLHVMPHTHTAHWQQPWHTGTRGSSNKGLQGGDPEMGYYELRAGRNLIASVGINVMLCQMVRACHLEWPRLAVCAFRPESH